MTSYGWTAPIAGRPPGLPPLKFGTIPRSQALFPPSRPGATAAARMISLNPTPPELTNWRERHLPGNPRIGGRRQWLARNECRRHLPASRDIGGRRHSQDGWQPESPNSQRGLTPNFVHPVGWADSDMNARKRRTESVANNSSRTLLTKIDRSACELSGPLKRSI
jgi:hypothetical protein